MCGNVKYDLPRAHQALQRKHLLFFVCHQLMVSAFDSTVHVRTGMALSGNGATRITRPTRLRRLFAGQLHQRQYG